MTVASFMCLCLYSRAWTFSLRAGLIDFTFCEAFVQNPALALKQPLLVLNLRPKQGSELQLYSDRKPVSS